MHVIVRMRQSRIRKRTRVCLSFQETSQHIGQPEATRSMSRPMSMIGVQGPVWHGRRAQRLMGPVSISCSIHTPFWSPTMPRLGRCVLITHACGLRGTFMIMAKTRCPPWKKFCCQANWHLMCSGSRLGMSPDVIRLNATLNIEEGASKRTDFTESRVRPRSSCRDGGKFSLIEWPVCPRAGVP